MTLVWRPGFYFDSGNRPAAIAGVAPTLDYRFARERREIEAVSLTDKLTYTGANGTFMGSDGFIQQATTNAPRFDHDPVTGESLGLLIEEARTNLMLNSGTTAEMRPTASTSRTSGGFAAPDGSTDASRVNLPEVTQPGRVEIVSEILGVSPNTDYIASVYLKGLNGGEVVYLTLESSVPTSSVTATLTTEWQRFDITGLSNSGVLYFNVGVDTRIGTGQSNQPAQSFYIWGAQVEEGSFPTSYIPTVSSTVTRTADSAIIDGAGVLTGTYTMIEKPASCAVESGGNIELQAGYTAERVMVFPAALSAQQITDIRSAM